MALSDEQADKQPSRQLGKPPSQFTALLSLSLYIVNTDELPDGGDLQHGRHDKYADATPIPAEFLSPPSRRGYPASAAAPAAASQGAPRAGRSL